MPQIILKRDKRLTVLIVGGAAAIIVVVLLALLWWVVMWQMHSMVVAKAGQLDGAGQLAQEQKVLEDYAGTHPPSVFLGPVCAQLGDVTYKQQEYAKAYAWYIKADTVSGKQQLSNVLGVARSAEAIGDDATAISYYKTAVTLTQKQGGGETTNETVAGYQDQIRYLEGKQ